MLSLFNGTGRDLLIDHLDGVEVKLDFVAFMKYFFIYSKVC